MSLAAIGLAYLRVGATAFGFAILQRLKAVAPGRGWLTEEEFNGPGLEAVAARSPLK